MNKEKHSDSYYLKMALAEAKKGRYTTSPNPAVGCVIVRNNKILGMGFHHCAGQPHAEVMALRAANYEVEGATCYVTLEPCSHYGRTPPCAQALIDAKVKKVVIGSTDPNPKVAGKGIKMLLDANIDVVKATGKLNKECLKLNRAFFKSITTNRPFTILKYGMSLDGKVALSSNESKWITNDQCRADVQRLRLWSDAVITSYKTVLSDNPKLNVRLEDLPIKLLTGVDTTLIKQPIKLILDSKATLLPNKQLSDLDPFAIFTTGENYIVVGSNDVAKSNDGAKEAKANTSKKKKKAKSEDSCSCCSQAQLDEAAPQISPDEPQKASDSASSKSSSSKSASSGGKKTAKSSAVAQEASASTSTGSSVSTGAKTRARKSASTSTSARAGSSSSASSKSASASSKSASSGGRAGTGAKAKANANGNAKAKVKVADKKAKELVLDTKKSLVCGVEDEVYAQPSWKIDESKVVARGVDFVVEKWSDRVFIVVVPFALGNDHKPHASISAALDFLGSKEIRVAMVEAGSSLGSAFLEQGLIDECYCYMSPMILGLEAKSAFAIHEPAKLCDALKFKKCKVKTFKSNFGLILSDPVRGEKSLKAKGRK